MKKGRLDFRRVAATPVSGTLICRQARGEQPEEKAELLEIARELYEHRPKDVRCFQLRWREM